MTRSPLSKLKNVHIVIVLRGDVTIPMMTSDSKYIKSNTVMGFLKGYDKEFLFIGQEEEGNDWKMLLKRSDVSALSITPTDEDLMMDSIDPTNVN